MAYTDEERCAVLGEVTLGAFVENRRVRRLYQRAMKARATGTPDIAAEDRLVDAVHLRAAAEVLDS